MSKVAIQGNASGTGTFTIAAPNSNTDRTLTLPDEAGTIITTAGVPASALPAGSVAKVQYYDVTPVGADISSTSATYSDFISISYTPVLTTSDIHIWLNPQLRSSRSGASDSRFRMRMLINGSSVWELQEYGIFDYGGGGIWASIQWPHTYKYSNTTGNSVAIKLQVHCDTRADSVTMYGTSGGQGRSTAQVIEVVV